MLQNCIKYSNSGWHLIDVPAVHSPFNFLPTFSTAFIKCHVSVSKEIGSGLMCSLGWMIFPLFQILRRQWQRETKEEEREGVWDCIDTFFKNPRYNELHRPLPHFFISIQSASTPQYPRLRDNRNVLHVLQSTPCSQWASLTDCSTPLKHWATY